MLKYVGIGWMMTACSAPPLVAVNGPEAVYDPEGLAFFSTPWPSDERRDSDGTLDISTFPNPFDAVLLEAYLARLDALDGFGTNSPIYLQLEGPLPAERMPSPTESMERRAPLMLVDIDPDSPFRGEQVPLQWEQNAFDDSVYMPEHLLAVAPLHGFPLRPSTTYALLLSVEVTAPNEAWRSRLDSEHPLHDRDLARGIRRAGYQPEDIAIGTVFTTSDPLDELSRIAGFVRELPEGDVDATVMERIEGFANYIAFRTGYRSPVFTEGEAPYSNRGGGFAFTDDGTPDIVRWDDMRLSVCVPRGVEAPPEGLPVVVYQHGTGGNFRTFCNSDGPLEVMNRLGEVGFVGLGIDQPLHGNRPGAVEAGGLAHFNLVNPESGITNFRQGAVDAIYLANQLARRQHVFEAPNGNDFPLDPDRVFFMGHSQGGLTGALAGPFFGGDIKAAVISGAGAILAITVVERKDVIDFEALVRDLTSMSEGEPFTTMHPIQGIIQTLVEPTDPANYAPYWFAEPIDASDHEPLPVLVTSGTLDEATPWRTTVALAAAGRTPLVGDAATEVDAIELRTGSAGSLPAFDNARAYDGARLTAGLRQYEGGTHFVVFEQPEASNLYVEFLESAAEGSPRLQD